MDFEDKEKATNTLWVFFYSSEGAKNLLRLIMRLKKDYKTV